MQQQAQQPVQAKSVTQKPVATAQIQQKPGVGKTAQPIKPGQAAQPVKKPSKWYFNRVKMVAKKRKILFNLNMKEFVDAYHGRCNLSGIPLTLVKMYAQSINQTASLDRIDSSQGYEKSNIQWVHKKINIMKNNLPEKEFFKFCNKIIENQN